MARDPGKNPRVVYLAPLAEKDFFVIYAYTAQLWGATQAEDYREFLKAVMQTLAHSPEAAPLVPNRGGIRVYTARWKNARQGHRIFFREADDGIFVLRILHTAMSWPEHLGADG